jgi:hypothetical protein
MQYKLSIILFLACANCHQVKPIQKTDYIEFKHVGPQEAIIRWLFVSDNKIDIQVDGGYEIINGNKSKISDIGEKMMISDGDYDVEVVNTDTFKQIASFINKFPNFLKSNDDLKTANFSAIFQGKSYNISFPNTKVFFEGLVQYLEMQHCNKDDVGSLNSYFHANFFR